MAFSNERELFSKQTNLNQTTSHIYSLQVTKQTSSQGTHVKSQSFIPNQPATIHLTQVLKQHQIQRNELQNYSSADSFQFEPQQQNKSVKENGKVPLLKLTLVNSNISPKTTIKIEPKVKTKIREHCAKPYPIISLSSQVPKIEKDDETVAMPTTRNNNSDADESEEEKVRTIEQRSISPTMKHDSNIAPRRLMNFNQAKHTMLHKLVGPQQLQRAKLIDQTPQMDTISLLDPSAIQSARHNKYASSNSFFQQTNTNENSFHQKSQNDHLTQSKKKQASQRNFNQTTSTHYQKMDTNIRQDERTLTSLKNFDRTRQSSSSICLKMTTQEEKQLTDFKTSTYIIEPSAPQHFDLTKNQAPPQKINEKGITMIIGDQLKKIINQIHVISPFSNNKAEAFESSLKYSPSLELDNFSKRQLNLKDNVSVFRSFQSENIMDTIDQEDIKKKNYVKNNIPIGQPANALEQRYQSQGGRTCARQITEQTQYLYNTDKNPLQSHIGGPTDQSNRISQAPILTQTTSTAYAKHQLRLSDETPKDQGRVDREEILGFKNKEQTDKLIMDPLKFEKEKVFQLVLDSSRIMECGSDEEQSRDSDIYDSQAQGKSKQPIRLSMYKETSFESLNTLDHLFITGSQEITSSDIINLINQESSSKVDKRQGKSNKKINKLKETLRKDATANGVENQSFQAYSISGGTSVRDDSIIEGELKKIYEKLNTFTIEQFQDLRNEIKKQGFSKMLVKVNNQLDEQESTFAELPSEMTITEDNREVQMNYNFKTFVASKKIHQPQDSNKQQLSKQIIDDSGFLNIERQFMICKETDNQLLPVGSLLCTGFNSQAPKLVFSRQRSACRGVLDLGSEKIGQSQIGGPLFLKMLTPTIIRQFTGEKLQIKSISCGFEHCIAVTDTGKVLSWGYGASGSLGHGNYISYTQPKMITAGELSCKFVSNSESGGYHTGAITEDGDLYMWGRADVGQLGIPHDLCTKDSMGLVSNAPVLLKNFREKNRLVKQIALGEAHTLVLDDCGEVYSFGWSELGQLGVPQLIGRNDSDFTVYKLEIFQKIKVKKISAGSISSVALTADAGHVYVWGSQQNGQLGIGPKNYPSPFVAVPTLVSLLAQEKIVNITCGDSHTIALNDAGQYYGWGKGFSLDSQVEVVSFYPKRLDSIEKHHCFILENQVEEKVNKEILSAESKNSKNFNPVQSVTDQCIQANDRVSEISNMSQDAFADLQIGIPLAIQDKSSIQTKSNNKISFNYEQRGQKDQSSQKKPQNLQVLQVQKQSQLDDCQDKKKLRHIKQQSVAEKINVEMESWADVEVLDMSQKIKKQNKRSRLLEESESFLASLHSSPNNPQYSENGPKSTTPFHENMVNVLLPEFDALTTEPFDNQKRIIQVNSSQASTLQSRHNFRPKKGKTDSILVPSQQKQKVIQVKKSTLQAQNTKQQSPKVVNRFCVNPQK